jgi:hypothetical protein
MKRLFLVWGMLFFFGVTQAQENHPVFHEDTIQQHKNDSMSKQKKKRADSIQEKEKNTRIDTSFGKPKVKKDSVSEQINPPRKKAIAFFCMPGEDNVLRLVFLIIQETAPEEMQDFLEVAEMEYYVDD